MAAVPLADAARLLGKPERTIRRWAAQGKLPATRTTDGWLIEISADADGHVAATDQGNGHSNGRVATSPSATGGQLATVPVTYLQELQIRAEAAAFWQGRASVLEQRVQQLEVQAALPAPPMPETAPQRPSANDVSEPIAAPAATPKAGPWWRFWR